MNQPVGTDGDVAAHLIRITLARAEVPALQQELQVGEEDSRMKCPCHRSDHAVVMIDLPLEVQEKRKGWLLFLGPLPRVVRVTECDDSHLTLALVNLVQPLAQLRHVLAASESPEVAQEDEMNRAPPV
jgi:hypothetical protein